MKSSTAHSTTKGVAPLVSTVFLALSGLVSLTGDLKDQQKVQILRDTRAAPSFIISDVVPLSGVSFCGSSVLVQGIEMGFVSVPLHLVHLKCDLVSGIFNVGLSLSWAMLLLEAECCLY